MFGPEWIRWWKEIVILLLVAVVGIPYLKQMREGSLLLPDFKGGGKDPRLWSFLFLVWGTFLVFGNSDPKTALVAFRYLGLGYLVFLIVGLSSYTIKADSKKKKRLFPSNFLPFICLSISLVISIIFGLWAQFIGGFEVLSLWYSQTISSWVPGQSIPLYHETGGRIRMQGMSSGPIEFSHLLLIGTWYWLYLFKTRSVKGKILSIGLVSLFSLGIYLSLSRAALIGLIILLLGKSARKVASRFGRTKTSLALIVPSIFVFVFQPLGISEMFNRAGTSDHITRPIEAMNAGIRSPFFGDLGMWGPAARAKNLFLNYSDYAPIAENVFADYFVQLGGIGLILALGFFLNLWRRFDYSSRIFLLVGLIVMNLATVFDMTPFTILYFLTLAMLHLPAYRK